MPRCSEALSYPSSLPHPVAIALPPVPRAWRPRDPCQVDSFLPKLSPACPPHSPLLERDRGKTGEDPPLQPPNPWLWPWGIPRRSLVCLPHPLPLPHFILSPLLLFPRSLFSSRLFFWLSPPLDPFPHCTPWGEGGVSPLSIYGLPGEGVQC